MPAQPVERDKDRGELVLAAAIVVATEACIWLVATKARWIVVVPMALLVLLWYRQSQTLSSLGLSLSAFGLSLRRWCVFWLVTTVSFLIAGWHTVFSIPVLMRGCVYFVWCLLQQLAFQSVVYRVLRKRLRHPWAAALMGGLVFALLHTPNPVLMAGTFVWGVAACVLFENCRSVLGLALLQVMLSSLLLWLVPYKVHHGLRVGPSYYRPVRSAPFSPSKNHATRRRVDGAGLGLPESQSASFTMVT